MDDRKMVQVVVLEPQTDIFPTPVDGYSGKSAAVTRNFHPLLVENILEN
jgi:hypothetical protein